MEQFASARRKDDLVLVVCQDNIQQKLKIVDCSENVTRLLGYGKGDLIEQNIDILFTAKTMTVVNSYLDYSDINYDIGCVLSKIRDCKIVAQNNEVIDAKIKIFPSIPEVGSNGQYFEILVRTFTFIDKLNKFREKTINYDSYCIVPELNVIDYNTMIQELNSVQQFHNLNGGESLVGCIDFKSDFETDIENLRIIIKAYELCTRDYDLIGHIGGNYLVFVILDCDQQFFGSVIKRIFESITSVVEDDKCIEIKHGTISQYQMLINIFQPSFK